MRVIAGTARGTVLKALEGLETRPTADRVKEAMFSIIQFEIPGKKVLDLFGGSGQLGIEAMSRGADSAVFVDASNQACAIVKENLKRTHFENKARVVCSDYLNFLKSCKDKFGVILLDPPYAEDFLEKSLKIITEIDILQSGGIIVTERPYGKELCCGFDGYVRSKDYKYGKTVVTIFRKADEQKE